MNLSSYSVPRSAVVLSLVALLSVGCLGMFLACPGGGLTHRQ